MILALLLVVLLLLFRIRRLHRQLEDAKLHEAELGATDRLIEFRLRQLTEQIDKLERARDEAASEPERDTPRHRRLG